MKRKFFSALLLMTLSVASVGMLVSCKDYDDDINSVRDDVTNLRSELETMRTSLTEELNAAKTELETQISDAKTQLQAAIDGKADQATVTALEARVATLEGDLAALKSTYEAKIAQIDEAMASYSEDIEGIKNTLATLTAADGDIAKLKERIAQLESKVSTLEGLDIEAIAKEAVKKDLEAQAEALQDFKDEIANADYQGQIDKLKEQLNNLPSSEDLKEMKEMLDKYDLETLSGNIENALTQIADLQDELANYATDADLSDLQTYLEGKLTTLSDDINKNINENVNGLTVFVEKLLSSIALVPDLYVGGIEAIEFKVLNYVPVAPGTSGEKELSGASAILVDNGMTTATYRLNPSAVQLSGIDQENIDYVAARAQVRSVVENSPVTYNGIKSFENGLMTVYLKKTNTESLDLGSDETYIVALKVPRFNKDGSTTDVYSENSRLVQTDFRPRIARLTWNALDELHHYADSASVWASQVDNDTKYVVKQINYNEKFDLTTIVTGCFSTSSVAHTEIVKDELKKYGLAFRFAIPTKVYNTGADHNTNQQEFASVTPEGILSSKLPSGTTDNRAAIGKEPIVRIMLCDTVRNQLVDERYMKVKWTAKKLEDVVLAERDDEATLNCNTMTASLDWEWVISQIYEKVTSEGMSQETFETVYPARDITSELIGSNKYTTSVANMPIFKSSTNEQGDAIVATWTLAPEDITDIYPNDSKTFTAKVTFKSSLPEEYPDLVMNWNFTINLPKLPSINGYYQNYWYDPYESHDVMAIQYGSTAAQGKSIVEFRNNLMNAFTYKNDQSFIVNDIPECGTWDIQFSLDQSVNGYRANYSGTEPLETEGVPYGQFGAYQLVRGTDQALRLAWNTGHESWDNDLNYRTASLYAAPNNEANWPLMNKLSQENEADGRTPKRTHDIKVNIGIWAKLNQWNVVPVKDYTVCLVAPLRVNANLAGYFEEGLVSGSSISCADAFTMTDFRGYTVAKTVKDNTEFEKYATQLYQWYDVKDPTFDLSAVRYGMKAEGGNIVVDDNLEYEDCMTAAEIERVTNGNIKLSITKNGDKLTFLNNGGSNVETECNVFIPATTRYAYGVITEAVKVRLYPRGQVPSNAKRR